MTSYDFPVAACEAYVQVGTTGRDGADDRTDFHGLVPCFDSFSVRKTQLQRKAMRKKARSLLNIVASL